MLPNVQNIVRNRSQATTSVLKEKQKYTITKEQGLR